MFCYKWGNSNRLWFPCIDSLSEICTWKIEVTADADMLVVCPGDLAEKVVFKLNFVFIGYLFLHSLPLSYFNQL